MTNVATSKTVGLKCMISAVLSACLELPLMSCALLTKARSKKINQEPRLEIVCVKELQKTLDQKKLKLRK